MKLLVIDIQKGITNEGLYNFKGFISNAVKIISAARKNNVEVIYVQHDDGPGTGFSVGDDDFEINEQIEPLAGEKIFTKKLNSCFSNEEFVDYLKEKNDNILMIIGLLTNFCIDATVRSAFDRGYKVILPNDANSTFDNKYMDKETTYKYYNEMMWPERFADCISVDKAISLLGKA